MGRRQGALKMTFDGESVNQEILSLCNEAIEQIRKVDANSKRQKKQIIIELAKNLEGKIPSNTISIEIVNQLRGLVSESFIHKCLDIKYKDNRRSQNAKQQNKHQSIELETKLENLLDEEEDDEKMKTETAPVVDDDGNNPALPVALDPEPKKEVIVVGSSGQMLIQKDNENNQSDDDANEPNPNLTGNQSSGNGVATREDPLCNGQRPEQQLDDDHDDLDLAECSNCRRLMSKNFELEAALLKSTKFTTAYKIDAAKDSDENNILQIQLPLTYRPLQEYMAKLFPTIGSNGKVWLNLEIDKNKGKVLEINFGKIDQSNAGNRIFDTTMD